MPELIIQNVSVLMTYDNGRSSRYNALRHDIQDNDILQFAETINKIQTTETEKITKRTVSEIIFV